MQDEIVREITVNANSAKVFQAITDVNQLTKWFPDVVEEGTLEVGENPVFIFTEYDHKTRIHVEASKPNEYFAYRWIPGGNSGLVEDVLAEPNTLVEFFIDEIEDGSKITIKESGFASLPPEIAENSLKDNSGGWTTMAERLEKYVNTL